MTQQIKDYTGIAWHSGSCGGGVSNIKWNACKNIKCVDAYRTGYCAGPRDGFVCTPCLACKPHEKKTQECSSDTKSYGCQAYASPCANGVGVKEVDRRSDNHCASCYDGYYLPSITQEEPTREDRMCHACANRQCSAHQYRTGSCTAFTKGFVCRAFAGTCRNGTLISVGLRRAPNHCDPQSCKPGYFPENHTVSLADQPDGTAKDVVITRCEPQGGVCDHGFLVPVELRTQRHHCGSCERGYYLSNCSTNDVVDVTRSVNDCPPCKATGTRSSVGCSTCYPFKGICHQRNANGSVIGDWPESFGTLEDQALRTQHNQCSSCDVTGFTFDAGKKECQPWGGTCRNGALVPFPYNQATGVRAQDGHCGRCDAGFHCGGKQYQPSEWRDAANPMCGFTHRHCTQWGGSCADGALIDTAARRQSNHCGSCKAGFYLSTCAAQGPKQYTDAECFTSCTASGSKGDAECRYCRPYEGECLLELTELFTDDQVAVMEGSAGGVGTLVAPSNRTRHNHCAQCAPQYEFVTATARCKPRCKPGHYMVTAIATCYPYGGKCDHGVLVPQGERSGHHQCGTCEAGHILDNGVCLRSTALCNHGHAADSDAAKECATAQFNAANAKHFSISPANSTAGGLWAIPHGIPDDVVCTMQSMMRSTVVAPLIESWGMVVELNPEDNNFGMRRGRLYARLTNAAAKSERLQADVSKELLGQSPTDNLKDMFGGTDSSASAKLLKPLAELFQRLVTALGNSMPSIKKITDGMLELLHVDKIKEWFGSDRITIPFVFAKKSVSVADSGGLGGSAPMCNATAGTTDNTTASPAYLQLMGAGSLMGVPTKETRRRQRRQSLYLEDRAQSSTVGIGSGSASGGASDRYRRDTNAINYFQYNGTVAVCATPTTAARAGLGADCLNATACMNGNTAYATLAEAWTKCGQTQPACTNVMEYEVPVPCHSEEQCATSQKTKNVFYLRSTRGSDVFKEERLGWKYCTNMTATSCPNEDQQYSHVYKKCRPLWCARMDSTQKDFYNVGAFEAADYVGRLVDLVIDNTFVFNFKDGWNNVWRITWLIPFNFKIEFPMFTDSAGNDVFKPPDFEFGLDPEVGVADDVYGAWFGGDYQPMNAFGETQIQRQQHGYGYKYFPPNGAKYDRFTAGQSQILTPRPFLSKWRKIWI